MVAHEDENRLDRYSMAACNSHQDPMASIRLSIRVMGLRMILFIFLGYELMVAALVGMQTESRLQLQQSQGRLFF